MVCINVAPRLFEVDFFLEEGVEESCHNVNLTTFTRLLNHVRHDEADCLSSGRRGVCLMVVNTLPLKITLGDQSFFSPLNDAIVIFGLIGPSTTNCLLALRKWEKVKDFLLKK